MDKKCEITDLGEGLPGADRAVWKTGAERRILSDLGLGSWCRAVKTVGMNRISVSKSYPHSWVHFSIKYSRQDMEATSVSING